MFSPSVRNVHTNQSSHHWCSSNTQLSQLPKKLSTTPTQWSIQWPGRQFQAKKNWWMTPPRLRCGKLHSARISGEWHKATINRAKGHGRYVRHDARRHKACIEGRKKKSLTAIQLLITACKRKIPIGYGWWPVEIWSTAMKSYWSPQQDWRLQNSIGIVSWAQQWPNTCALT